MVHKITGWIFGYLMVYLEHEGAGRFINLCRNNGIEIWNIRADEEKKILWFNIGFRNFWRIHHIAVKCHVFPRVYKRYGLPFLIERSKKNLNFVLGVISFFTMLFTPELSRLCVISVPFLSLNVDSVIIGTSNFSPISTHLS